MKRNLVLAIFSLLASLWSPFLKANSFFWHSLNHNDSYYASAEAIRIANNVVDLQRPTGGWRKGIDPSQSLSSTEKAELLNEELRLFNAYDNAQSTQYSHTVSTLDNQSTHTHVRYLLRVARQTGNANFKAAAIKGINYILAAQYPSGGWPQNYPNLNSYGGYVTLNDGAMSGAMTVLKEVASGEFGFIDKLLMDRSKAAFQKGVEYLLESQIIIEGKRTAWAQQYSENYTPARGRTYEPPAIAAYESADVLELLMSIKSPSIRVKRAVTAAILWFENAKILNIELTKVYSNESVGTINVIVKEDPNSESSKVKTISMLGYDIKVQTVIGAPPIWARYYDLKTSVPIFCGWDGVTKSTLKSIDYDRRVRYQWYGYWPRDILKYGWKAWASEAGVPMAPKNVATEILPL